MTLPLDQSICELLNASRDDEEIIGLPVNDRSFGFHAQQSIEKLLKSLIGGHEQRYKYTHDIADLLIQVFELKEVLPFDRSVVDKLTDYAGIWRYQEPQPIGPERRIELQQAVASLRVYVVSRLSTLRPTADWSEFR